MTSLNATQKFYKDKTIFITGASGFMGKCLLEKLLYSCSEVKEILILMRPKRGKTAKERVADFANLPVSSIIDQLYFSTPIITWNYEVQFKLIDFCPIITVSIVVQH